jgi:O-antigen/teichoic acid export membrane protein
MSPVLSNRLSLKTWRSNAAVRAAAILVGGTAAAQIIAVLALPILTRVYSPADFTILATYSALLFMLVYAATGRFDLAIPLVADDKEAANLLVLAVLCSVSTAGIIGLAVLCFGTTLAHAVSLDETGPYLWLLPISLALAGSFLAFQNWWLRRHSFRLVAATRLSQVLTGVSIQLGMGFGGWKPIGLLIGHLMIAGAGSVRFLLTFWRDERRLLRSITLKSLKTTAYTHRQYPQYSVVDAVAANAGEQLPLVIIAALSAGPEAGLLLLTMRVLGAPVDLLANAIAQVYLSTVAQAERDRRLSQSTERLVRALMIYGSAPFLFGSLATAPLFGIVFGERWTAAGSMIFWVAPWYAMRLSTAPLLSLPALLGRQRQIMVIRITTLFVRAGAVYVGLYLWNGRSVEALAIASFAHWLLLMGLLLSMAGVRLRELGFAFLLAPLTAALGGILAAQLFSSVMT